MSCQYPTDAQYDWRNTQLANYNMLQQPGSSYNPNDYPRADYSANFAAANYALAQAQISQAHASNLSRLKEQQLLNPNKELSSGTGSSSSTQATQQNPVENHQWTKHEEWSNHLAASEVSYPNEAAFMQSPYLANSAKHYWA